MNDSYEKLISIDNLFQAWTEFRKGKSKRKDVQVFERNLEDNLFKLHHDLKNKTYKHGGYHSFYVNDPKRRHIHKAQVSDRVIHHLLYKYLYSLFDRTFIFDSYSCRLGKGTHKAVERLEYLARKVSRNYTQDCWALKCDIKKFFASVDQKILMKLTSRKVKDPKTFGLIQEVINSFHSETGLNKGIPLGNLTSQICANIYLSELDQYVKHQLGVNYYLRYADDFIILSPSKLQLHNHLKVIRKFLHTKLKLELHPNKVIFRKLDWGIDFCGYIALQQYKLVRAKTEKRIFKKVLTKSVSEQSLQSYLGHFSHANAFFARQNLKNLFFFKHPKLMLILI